MADIRPKLTYEENQALAVIRTARKRKPELANAIMEGMSREVAVNVLLQVQRELADLMAVSQAFTAASGKLAQLDKKEQSNDES